jgi:tetratricopeptide (TPR) repeat protein
VQSTIQAYDKVIEIYPESAAEAWYKKGDALKELDRTVEADDAFIKAEELEYGS